MRIGSFENTVRQSFKEAHKGSGIVGEWENDNGVRVTVTLNDGMYQVSVEGANVDEPSPKSTIRGGRDAAYDVMKEVSH